ncbi:MAG: hypothetical protein IPM42_05525 [Saprospiraceae bacterium]|nr:hypothetical protein [Saprospiraceae bacterium]
MKEKQWVYLLLAAIAGGLIIWLWCCKGGHGSHSDHTFKIWKGYIQKDSTKESEFTNLKMVKFLTDSYYLSVNGDKDLVDSQVYFLHVARKIPTAGSPFEAKAGFIIPDSINLISIVDREYLDQHAEFIRCRTTGKFGCIPEFLVNSLDTVKVQREGADKILLRLPTAIHHTNTYEWGYLELSPSEYPVVIGSTTPDLTGACLSIVIDAGASNTLYDNGNTYPIYKIYSIR